MDLNVESCMFVAAVVPQCVRPKGVMVEVEVVDRVDITATALANTFACASPPSTRHQQQPTSSYPHQFDHLNNIDHILT